jgi:proline iminopeptidase
MFFDVEGEAFVADTSALRARPTLLLIHGAEVDHTFFKPWLSPLVTTAQLVYLDLVGHGRSDAGTDADWTLDAWADAVEDLCDRIDLDRPVILGSSLGGRVAMKLALRHPERPRALILVNTVGRSRPDRRIEMLTTLGGVEAGAAARRDHEHQTPQSIAEYHRLCMPLMVQRPYTEEELGQLQPVAPGVMDRLIELGRGAEDLLPNLGDIRCPVLVMTGELDPAATPDDAADIAAAIGANAELQVINGAGHGVYRDQPQMFVHHTRSFLDRLA